jgi:archaellum component FlaC
VSEENTQNLQGGRSFEDRIFAKLESIDARFDAVDARFDAVDARFDAVDARFDGVDAAIRDLDSRVERLEIRSYDTKPIWEQALKEILETKRDVAETRRVLTKRLDRFESIVLETRADLRDAEERIEKLETKPIQ